MKENKTCGMCLFQSNHKSDDTGGAEYLCLIDDKWHKGIDTCKRWKRYHNIPESSKIQIVTEVECLKAAAQMQLKQLLLSFFLGVAATLLTQWIINLWE